jgi:hypothetical protein
MWANTYQERLQQWAELRTNLHSQKLEDLLMAVNDWWQFSPSVNRHLLWADWESWPTPWQMLADNRYCDLAKALGIVYTIIMLERSDIDKVELVHCDLGNLVLVNDGKYILNYAPGELLNIHSSPIQIYQAVTAAQLEQKIS